VGGRDTARLAWECDLDERWVAPMDDLKQLQRVGRGLLARAG
jgi:hypothetical protein